MLFAAANFFGTGGFHSRFERPRVRFLPLSLSFVLRFAFGKRVVHARNELLYGERLFARDFAFAQLADKVFKRSARFGNKSAFAPQFPLL